MALYYCLGVKIIFKTPWLDSIIIGFIWPIWAVEQIKNLIDLWRKKK